jgi:hypothetical protein
MQGRCESIAAKCSHEFGIDPRVDFEPAGDIGPCCYLDFADKMPERRRPQAVQVQDKALTAHPCISSLRFRPVLLYLLNVNAAIA